MKVDLIVAHQTMASQKPLITRPRLLGVLERSLASCTSTIVSGRGGSGKTALALDFAGSCGRRVAWYKVDAADAEVKIFLQYLVASVQAQRPGFGVHTLLPLIETAELSEIQILAEALVYELGEPKTGPLLIVIEDLHLVYDSKWILPFFQRLLPLLPSEVHVLITSRSMPPAPLWRMRSKQTLLVIDDETLAFTMSEAKELFESYGLSSDHARTGLDQTHGRASALAEFASGLSRNRTNR